MRFRKYLNEEYEINHISGKSKIKTNIPPEKREFNNLPKDSKGKAKVKFQDWLEMECFGSKKLENGTRSPNTYGKAANGKWYGWSHRAIAGFAIGDKVSKDCCGNINPGKEWTIKTEEEAKKQAIAFADDVG